MPARSEVDSFQQLEGMLLSHAIPTAFISAFCQKWGGVAWQALFTVVRDRKRALKAEWEESKHAVAMAVGYSLSLFQFGSVICYSSCSSRFIFQLLLDGDLNLEPSSSLRRWNPLPGASLWRRVRAADLLEGHRWLSDTVSVTASSCIISTKVCPWRRDDK